MELETGTAAGGVSRRIVADLSLLFVTLIWGTTFVVVKNALADIGPFWFVGIRFGLAFLFLAVLYHRRLLAAWRSHARLAGLIGLVLFGGFALQTIGLEYTTAANSGFITGLSVILVPVIGRFWGQKGPGPATVAGIISAVLGLGLLTLSSDFRFNVGDVLTLLAAVAFGAHIVMVGQYAPRGDAVVLAILQIGAVAAAGLAGGFAFEPVPAVFSRKVWVALAVTAIPATAVALVVQNTMQRFTTATRTAIIFAMEPVFAGLAAYLLLGEILTVKQIIGCVLIVAGMIISELG
ncbi:DMT family transporter [Sporolituus thermophilus]|uniref:EamA-like transporter family protein n=1 Tax=Sporolituus thermophilus DSM 23256 TaxID=1123285 RepID=A0A1G7K6N0_9FIRM|nr:DMT family transporter [Sporolituus thermophilus]SDF32644.1 EamA-like transporter family protein [Sporolituus thermophilus DSM 23256]